MYVLCSHCLHVGGNCYPVVAATDLSFSALFETVCTSMLVQGLVTEAKSEMLTRNIGFRYSEVLDIE